MSDVLKKVGGSVHRFYMGVFGNTRDGVVGRLDWRELGSAFLVGATFYLVSGNLQDVLKDIDPSGQAVNNLMSMITAFIVSILHKSATGTKTKDGNTYHPGESK
jgi:hypothetical protein